MILRRPRHLVFLGAGLPVLAVYPFVPSVAQDVLYGILGAAAGGACIAAGLRFDGWQRKFWWLLALGLALFVAGDSISSWYEQNGGLPFPSAADAVYLGGYVSFAVGCVLLVVQRSRRDRLLDSAMLALAVAFAGFLLLVEPNGGGFDLATVTALAYPIMDVLLFSLLAWLVLSRLGVAYRLLALSLAVLLATDVVYAQIQLHTTYNGGLIDLGWLGSYLLWGAAALHPSRGWPAVDPSERPRLALLPPVVAFFTLPVVLLGENLLFGHVEGYGTTIGGGALATLAAVRLSRLVTSEQRFRTRAEQSERYFRSLIENSTDLFSIMSADGHILYESPSVEKILGYEPHELVGASVFGDVHPDDVADVQRELAGLLEHPDAPVVADVRFRAKDGRWVPLQATATNRLHDPAVQGIVICSRDLSEERAAQAEHERLQQELHQSQKMDAIGRLAGGVAHDFNNLLMVISASTEAGLLELPDGETSLRKKLDQTAHAVQRAAALTQQLLTFSRRHHPAFRVVDLNAQIETTCGMLRRIIGENIRIAASLAEPPPPIEADPAQIDQVLLNLALNARDAMPDGGTITFSTQRAGDQVLLGVADTGIGMDEETRSRLFEPFFTTKQPGSGTGLGLATVYGIVTQTRGTIHVDSAPGKGTRFTLEFPVAAGGPEESAEPVTVAAAGRETILLVEDEEVVRGVVREGLEQHGYRVVDTGDPRTAVALALDERIDILVTDIRMPHMNGFDLYDRLREVVPGSRAVFMSGYSDTAYLHRANGNPTVFIEKPFAISDLTQALRKLLEEPVPA